MDDKYFWTHESGVTIDDFLQKVMIRVVSLHQGHRAHGQTKPSIITDDMTPWIWVKGTSTTKEDPERTTKHAEALGKAQDIRSFNPPAGRGRGHVPLLTPVARLEKRHKEIQADDSIPSRGKKGVKSKKQTRDETLEVVKEELKALSIESGWTTGKWLFFPRGEAVDGMWSTIAKSVAEGPLKEAGVDLAKVASAPLCKNEGESPSHLICTYMDNVYDKQAVGKVLHALLAEHGLEPSACKSDLYTLAGIDSKHPSGIRSSLWRPAEKLKDQHWARTRDPHGTGTKKSRTAADGLIDSDSEDEKVVQATKRKAAPVETSKPLTGGPVKPKIVAPPQKKAKSAAIKFQEEDIFGGSDSD